MKINGNGLIYMPKGAAGEYAEYACNFYVGCSNGCTYCYNKHGLTAKTLGGDKATLRKCFKDEDDAFMKFKLNVDVLVTLLQSHGIFFSFTSDPCLHETWPLHKRAIDYCIGSHVPVTLLTKRADGPVFTEIAKRYRGEHLLSVGFSLTGMNDMEPQASSNHDRLLALRYLVENDIKTWVSIEPVIDIERSRLMMSMAYSAGCKTFKVGLVSGQKRGYTSDDVRELKAHAEKWFTEANIYWKHSVTKFIEKGGSK